MLSPSCFIIHAAKKEADMAVRKDDSDEGRMFEVADYGRELPREIDPGKPYWVLGGKAALFGMPHPNRLARDGQKDLFKRLQNAKVQVIINLSGRRYANPDPNWFDYQEFFITDGGPMDGEQNILWAAVAYVVKSLKAGKSVVIHCEGGTGRTGVTIGCVLCKLGKGTGQDIAIWLSELNNRRPGKRWPEASIQGKIVRECCPDKKGNDRQVIDPATRNIKKVSLFSDEERSFMCTVVAVNGDRITVRRHDTGEVIEVSSRFLQKQERPREEQRNVQDIFASATPEDLQERARQYPYILLDEVQRTLALFAKKLSSAKAEKLKNDLLDINARIEVLKKKIN